jgi:Putative Ig domain
MLRPTRSLLLVLSALFSFAFIVSLTGCGGSSKPTVSIATPAVSIIDPGDSITLTATVEHSSGEGVTWTLAGSGCSGSACGALSNQSSSSATYTAPTPVTTAFSVTITATSAKDTSVTGTVTLNIPANPAITTALGALTAGQVGSTYTATVAVSGGVSPYTWTVKSGNLPTGLTLGASSGAISGTPTASGDYSFALEVTDSGSPTALTASGQFTINIAPAPAIQFITTSLVHSVVGDAYTDQVNAIGGAGTLTYAVTAGNLPAGLSMANTGAITGKSTTVGTNSFTVAASDAYGDSATDNLAITIDPIISVNAPILPAGYAGSAYPATTFAATGGLGAPYTWTWVAASGSSLPPGLSFSNAGVVFGTPATGGTYSVVVTAKDTGGNTGSATASIVIDATLAITTASLPTGYVGSVYPQTSLVAAGGAGSPYTWTWAPATGSSLPAGLSLSSAGVMTGTPTTAGTYSVVVTVKDSASHTATATLTITVNAALSVTTASLPTGYAGSVYPSTTLAATGGAGSPYAWTWAAAAGSSLPAGLNLSGAGVITGTPTTAGSYSVVITAKDSAGNTASATFTITIGGAVSITTTSLPNGIVGAAYAATQLGATGGAGTPYTWTWAAGSGSSLPAGLNLSTGGLITGTPTTAGTSNVDVTAKDSAGNTASTTLTIVIEPTLSITTATLPTGYVGTDYPQITLVATGGTGSGYTWTWAAATGSSLPAGLNLSTTGVITGTPTTAGTYSVVFTATDSASHKATAALTIVVNAGVSVTTASLPAGYVGSAYTQTTLAATGGAGSPYTWTWAAAAGSSLPGGLNLSGAGVLTGTPTTSGSYSVVITAKDSARNTGSMTFTITVTGAVSITTTSLPTGYQGTAYTSTQLAATGGAGTPYTWTWVAGSGSSLPAGLGLSTGGLITGTPTASGTFSVVITAKDSAGNTAQATFSIVVEGALAITSPAMLPAGELPHSYTQQLVATGGSGTGYSWSTNGAGTTALQSLGLSLGTTGQIVTTGASPVNGSASFAVTVTDSASHTATTTFSLTIYTALQDNTGSFTGYVSSAFTGQAVGAGGEPPYTWSWSGQIPPGLVLSASGAITGTPTTAGPYSPLVTLRDTAGFNIATNVGFTINGPVSVSPIALPNGYPNSPYTSTQLNATGGTGTGYTWTWAAAPGSSLPAGLNLSTTGQITGTPTTAGTYSVVVTAKDSANNVGSATLSIVVEAKLAFTPTTSLPTGAVSEAYPSTTLTPSGGSGSGYSFTATGLPPGLVLSAGGVLSGTPTTQGTYSSVVVTLTDSASHSSSTTLTITINASLAITTTSPLPAGVVNAPYSQQLVATGGAGTLTWTAASSNLGGFALSLSGTGLVSGTPNGQGTINFTANVKDTSGASASVPFTFQVYGALQQNAANFPATGTTGVTYSGTISGAGGSGNYCWVVTGLSDVLQAPSNNAPCGYAAPSITISGLPTSAATVAPTVKLIDTTTTLSDSMLYSLVISNPTPLTLPPPEPASLPSATVNDYYNGSIAANGGVGPTFTWTVDGLGISSPGLNVSIGDGLSATTSDNNILSITGTPTSTTPQGSPLTFTAQVSDAYSHNSSTVTYSIAVNGTSTVSGQIFPININICNGSSFTYPTFAVSINTTPVQVTSTDSNGNFSFTNVPNGTYTITPSIDGAESIFYPLNYSGVVINDNSVTGENFFTSIAYTVSGNITYNGALTGTTYINLQPSGCGGGSGYPGTSIPQTTLSGGGAYTIRGVPPGDYTINAGMDPLGQGQGNTEDPQGSAALVVSTSNVTGANVTMVNPTQTAPTQVVKFKAIAPTNLGAFISYGSGSVENSNGVEVFTSYIVQWSTSLTGFGTTDIGSGSATFAAVGSHANVWIVNNGIKGISGSFSNNQAYYFRVQGLNPAGAGPWTYYGGPNVVCNTTTCATSVTIGAPSGTGYYAVSGTVTIPSSITPKGPLYVGMFDQNTNTAYGVEIASPSNSTPNSYTVYVPNGTAYFNFAILDQNNDGLIAAVGDISNTQGNNSEAIVVNNQALTNQDLTLPTAATTASVTTSYNQNVNYGGSGTNTSYGIGFDVRSGNGSKLPVGVTLMSGPNVLHPVDMGNYCQSCGTAQWQYYPQIESTVPKVGDSYTFNVTYSDTTSETLTTAVSAVLGPANAVSALTPNPNTTTATTTPTFTWNYPANAGNYTYQFYMQQNNGGTIWQIPGNNSNSNGFTNTQIPMPAGLVYGTDPTDNTNTPQYSSLTSGLQYNWSIQAQDSNGNSASVSTYFTPQ